MQNKILMGHLFALVTILLWGTTFISTKVLLRSFTPIEILFFRFIMGLIVLFLIYPYRLKVTDKKQEWIFAGAGLSGITLYYLFENIALVYAPASNVGVITATAPFFTALLACRFLAGEALQKKFIVGFVLAIAGIAMISFNSATQLQINPLGDFLALAAALTWAVMLYCLKNQFIWLQCPQSTLAYFHVWFGIYAAGTAVYGFPLGF